VHERDVVALAWSDDGGHGEDAGRRSEGSGVLACGGTLSPAFEGSTPFSFRLAQLEAAKAVLHAEDEDGVQELMSHWGLGARLTLSVGRRDGLDGKEGRLQWSDGKGGAVRAEVEKIGTNKLEVVHSVKFAPSVKQVQLRTELDIEGDTVVGWRLRLTKHKLARHGEASFELDHAHDPANHAAHTALTLPELAGWMALGRAR